MPPRDAEKIDSAGLRRTLAQYQTAMPVRIVGQLASSFIPFVALCGAMYATIDVSVWLTLALSVLAAGFMVRIFIIQHDCGHGSFLSSRAANDWVGRLCSIATMTPYAHWRRQHAAHHANWNNLDRRESGSDIYSACLTVKEYRALSPLRRTLYRAIRHPAVALLVLPPLVFLLLYRLPFDTPSDWRRERRSVYATNLVLGAIMCSLGIFVGFGAVATVQLPIIAFASIIGVWLFSVQHRFEAAQWFGRDDWSAPRASISGTSYLRLPAILQWFTGNIGFHHVHHFNPRIPNYRLAACHAAIPYLQQVPTLGLGEALKAASYWLWDETDRRMIRFNDCPRAETSSSSTAPKG